MRPMEFVAEEAKRLQSLDDEVIRHLKSSLLSASFSVSVPNVSWNLVGGVNVAKRALEEAVIWPSTRSEDLRRMGVKPPRGILLVGPPGVGKTLLAKAVATASRSHFLTASISSLVDAASGESAAKIRDLFSVARQCAPSVVFLDEFQALFGTCSFFFFQIYTSLAASLAHSTRVHKKKKNYQQFELLYVKVREMEDHHTPDNSSHNYSWNLISVDMMMITVKESSCWLQQMYRTQSIVHFLHPVDSILC